ncbi:dTMP kinase, partial [Streptomyces sp. NPDC058459]
LPKFSHRDADETAVLPPVRDDAPADRTPLGYFRDERPAEADDAEDRTREMPRLGADGKPRRPRPDWAEETPLDDLPSLADELLGSYDEQEEQDERGRRGRGRRS